MRVVQIGRAIRRPILADSCMLQRLVQSCESARQLHQAGTALGLR